MFPRMPGLVPGFRFLVTALFCDDRRFAIRFLDRARCRIFKPDLRRTRVSRGANALEAAVDFR
jgi:hypothetical protein